MVIFKNKINLDISEIPIHKRIANSTITVDCFDVPVKNCTHYFLSHFHSDHYTRLGKSFEHFVYCSKTTAELVASKIGAKAVGLEMYVNYNFSNFVVRLTEANHCPGAVLFIFLINGKFFLHTGDFRYCEKYHNFNIKFQSIYLDNTYENFLNFSSQKEAITSILNRFDQKNKLCPMNVCVLCVTYCIGKEKVFLSIAEYLDQKVQVTEEKMEIYKCFSKYTVDKINLDVVDIVNEKRQTEKTYGFKRQTKSKICIGTIKQKSRLRKVRNYYPAPDIVQYSDEYISQLDAVTNPDKKALFYDYPSPISIRSFQLETDSSEKNPKNNFANIESNNTLYSGNEITTAFDSKNSEMPFDNNNSSFTNSERLCHHHYQKTEEEYSSESDTKSKNSQPFDRLTLEESPIKVISPNQLHNFQELVSKIYSDKIIILCGTGWKEKIEKKPFKRLDGRLIKDGIEIVYFRYSEHSSSQELDKFLFTNNFVELYNTVNRPGQVKNGS